MDPEIRRILEGFSDTERADWRRLFGDRFPLDYRIPGSVLALAPTACSLTSRKFESPHGMEIPPSKER